MKHSHKDRLKEAASHQSAKKKSKNTVAKGKDSMTEEPLGESTSAAPRLVTQVTQSVPKITHQKKNQITKPSKKDKKYYQHKKLVRSKKTAEEKSCIQ
jgi:hypothetical protein